MRRIGGGWAGAALVMAMTVGSLPAMAQDDYEHDAARPSGGAMVADALLARPLLAAATVGGTAVFLVSLPFSALGGNVDAAAETLIKAPAEATFRRCLGCEVSRRADEM
ncbi:hypothetical protein [Halomonas nitroreducens]|uniref:Multidrug transporter n=1 Tax=Halomonas nitroreducens TaxID=447425 RepID=A0A431UZA9_9GAMM|nr:hypothetical protein [Halomonas nitroreducens]RTQ98918.1 hypothetical protein EKG36_18450 [Halomonas nitroreducens]